jgi:hypothetical protein
VIIAHAGAFYGGGSGALGVATGARPSYASLAVFGLAWAVGQMFAMGTLFFMAGCRDRPCAMSSAWSIAQVLADVRRRFSRVVHAAAMSQPCV